MFRLLLVTLLTVGCVTAENSTSIPSSPAPITISIPSTVKTFTIPPTAVNLSLTAPSIVVETNGESQPTEDSIGTEVQELDLSKLNDGADSASPNDTKIETNAIIDDAPKIIMTEQSDDNDYSDGVHATFVESDDDVADDLADVADAEAEAEAEAEATETEAPTTETTTTKKTTVTETEAPEKTTEKPYLSDGVVLPVDEEKEKENKDKEKNNGEETVDYVALYNERVTGPSSDAPQTFWDRSQDFVAWFASKNASMSLLLFVVLFSLLFLMVYLVLRECCKRKHRFSNRPYRYSGGITDDLYNTSSCSHQYQKVTLPDQKEVTMQLVSADCTLMETV